LARQIRAVQEITLGFHAGLGLDLAEVLKNAMVRPVRSPRSPLNWMVYNQQNHGDVKKSKTQNQGDPYMLQSCTRILEPLMAVTADCHRN